MYVGVAGVGRSVETAVGCGRREDQEWEEKVKVGRRQGKGLVAVVLCIGVWGDGLSAMIVS